MDENKNPCAEEGVEKEAETIKAEPAEECDLAEDNAEKEEQTEEKEEE